MHRSYDRNEHGEGAERSAEAPVRVRDRIVELAEPIVAASRCELVSVEYRREPHGWVLRLYVERLGHDPRKLTGGVTLEECTRISRDLSLALDVAELIEHAYHLEVSSPGLDRPLTKPEDYVRFVGLRAKIQLTEPDPRWTHRRVFRGEILPAAEPGQIALREDDLGELSLPFVAIAKAHLVYQTTAKPKPGKQSRNAAGKP